VLAVPGITSGAVIGTAIAVCESRGDVLMLVDPPFGLRPQQVVDWSNGVLPDGSTENALNTSYGALYWSWIKRFNQFSAEYEWVPPSGYVAAVIARTARDYEPWYAPAGLTRGRLTSALAVEYSPTEGERDLLYGNGNVVNPIVDFPQDGIIVFGQRTLQRAPTALDRVSVRLLMTYLKKLLTRSLRQFIFEPNDTILRAQVTNVLDPLLGDVLNRRGVTAYKIVCNDTNNTAERIDRQELWVSIFVKPTKAVEFIALNLVVLRTGASFTAEEILAAGGVVATN
jgi:phage tail sheath protein FI